MLNYNESTQHMLLNMQQYADSTFLTYLPGYIDELNHICPSCQKQIPLNPDNEPDYGDVRAFIVEGKYLIPYATCRLCSINSFSLSTYSLEEYLLKCLGLYEEGEC